MHHVLGILLYDNENEIIEDESPGKGSYKGLDFTIIDAKKMMRQNPKIRQINIYRADRIYRGFSGELSNVQEPRVLVQTLYAENESKE